MDNQQVKNFIVSARQKGIPDDQILAFVKQKTAPAIPTGYSDTGADIKQVGTGISNAFKEAQTTTNEAYQAKEAGEQTGAEAFFQTVGAGAKALSNSAGEVIKGGIKAALPQEAETAIKEGIGVGVNKAVELTSKYEELHKTKPVLAGALNLALGGTPGMALTAKDIISGYNQLKTTNPRLAKNIDGALGIAQLAFDVATLGEGKAVATVAKDAAMTGAEQVAKQTGKFASEAAAQTSKVAGEVVSAVAPKAEKIMSNVARINPTDATKFEQMAGKTHGQYLVDTGNFGTPQQIITKELEKFTQSVKAVDDTLAKLPGTYSPREAVDVANTLTERLVRVKSPEAKRAIELSNKLESQGLNMSELNELKRMFERNVKLVFNKANNPDAVALASNMDNALREWQFAKADELGFSNIADMNKQTQLSKFIVDKLGGKVISSNLLNSLELTDWIMLSGGNPTAVAGLVTKKIFSDPGVQAKLAKFLTKTKASGAITPKLGETKLLRIEAPKGSTITSRGSGSTIPVAPKGSKMEFTGQTPGVIPEAKTKQLLKRKSVKKALPKVSTKGLPKANKLSTGLEAEAKKYKSGKEFYELSGSKVNQQLRDKGIRGQEQVTKYWEELTGKKSADSYSMSHRPQEMGSGYNIDELGNAPDFYSKPEYFKYSKDGTYDESITALLKIKGKPEATVTVYRASPKGELNKGDWISLSKKYAKGESLSEGTKVHSFKVKAKDIQFAGDDINEFGYFPKQ